MMPKLVLFVSSLFVLTACQQMPLQANELGEGSRIVLHQPLTVEPGHTRVFLQHGQVVGKTALNRYLPHCNFEIRHLGENAQTIEPDSFLVTRVSMGDDIVVENPSSLKVAALDNGTVVAAFPLFPLFDDSREVSRYTRLLLASALQPEVMRLTCHGGFDEPFQAEHPSVNDIRQSLGSIAELMLN